MELKGKTVFVVLTEGQYPGNNLSPELFADEAEAQAYKIETEADWSTNPPGQQYWCEIETITIR